MNKDICTKFIIWKQNERDKREERLNNDRDKTVKRD